MVNYLLISLDGNTAVFIYEYFCSFFVLNLVPIKVRDIVNLQNAESITEEIIL